MFKVIILMLTGYCGSVREVPLYFYLVASELTAPTVESIIKL